MNNKILFNVKEVLDKSNCNFATNKDRLKEEIEEDFLELVDAINICNWHGNYDGTIKTIYEILNELNEANSTNNRDKCLESLICIRIMMSDLENAASNCEDVINDLIKNIMVQEI